MTLTRNALAQRDSTDSLATLREQFDLPAGIIYLDGNSLGVLPRATAERVQAVVTQEWGTDLIRSWNTAGWIDLPLRVGDKIGRLVGAAPGSLVVADSTSINLFKVLAAAVRMQAQDKPGRRVILSESDNFPTDLYMAQGLADLLQQGHELRLVPAEQLHAAIDESVAVVMATQVNYRSGFMHDMAATTARAHAMGALTIWDLAHSAGAVPVNLDAACADFAVGCGYKYLNGGPGAPAFVYVAPRHQERFWQPLAGWMGHAKPFAFTTDYQPAPGIGRYLCGTPPVLSMAALECGVDTLLAAEPLGGMAAIRAKSIALVDTFIELVESRCACFGLALATPREAARRGSQASFAHEHGWPIMQALIERGVIGDFRAGADGAPGLLRFGFTPLYVRHVDVWDAVEVLRDVLASGVWREARFQQKAKVT